MTKILLLILSIIMFLVVLCYHFILKKHNEELISTKKLTLHNNQHVPILNPPSVIEINENNLSCHKIPTRCTSNVDCQLCAETLAACQFFHEQVVLEIDDKTKFVINPGDRYCFALDNRNARSCNPHTGTWVLRQVDTSNYALICHCDMPGLVTQLNIYEDCTVPVGCKPHGVIANIYTTPMVCLCETGFVPELSETNTPYCRPRVMRDVMLDIQFYQRPPCRAGFLPSEHPAFDPFYRAQIGANICLPDPCSIDPITGERHAGRVFYNPTGNIDGGPLVMCQCAIEDNLYPVYSPDSMLATRYSNSDNIITNYCLKPLTVDRRDVRSDLKVFWARNSLKSDADIVFQVERQHVHENYWVLLYPRLTPHPTAEVTTSFVMKFQLTTAYISSSPTSSRRDVFQNYCYFGDLLTNEDNCPLPAYGQCSANSLCTQACTMCAPVCEPNYCINNILHNAMRHRCYFFRVQRSFPGMDNVGHLCIWNYPHFYHSNNVPVTFFINALVASVWGYDNRTLHFTTTEDTLPPSQYGTAVTILGTYPFYSS